MKIKNNTPANLSVFARSTRGSANKLSMVVPGEATLELDDEMWKEEFAEVTAPIIAAGHLEIIEDVELTEEDIEKKEAEELAAAEALIESKKASKETSKKTGA